MHLDVTRLVQLWQSSTRTAAEHLPAIAADAGGGLFTRAVFHSTRSHVPDQTDVAPRLRLTYQRPFPFENQ